MRKVVIHAGSVKTGSSYIQSSLALSAAVLSESGYVYPDHPNNELARQGLITSGNLSAMGDWIGEIYQGIEESPSDATLIYSNESMVNALIRHPEHLAAICKVAELEIIIFLRDPYDHFCSFYGQLVKRHGLHCDPMEAIPWYPHFHEAAQLLRSEKNDKFKLQIVNYDSARETLLETFGRRLGIERPLIHPISNQINRSLTNTEMLVQKIFNQFYGAKSHEFISDALCEELPDLKGEHVLLTERELEALRDWVEAPLQEINATLPPEQSLPEPTARAFRSEQALDASEFALSKRQIEAIARRLQHLTARWTIREERYTNALEQLEAAMSGLETIEKSGADAEAMRAVYSMLLAFKPDHPLTQNRLAALDSSD